MSATAVPLSRAIRFYEATIGKKAVMAVTGAILVLFVIGHLIGKMNALAYRELPFR
jgi:succinate dehydrogenase / fumarate reductase cytochrome b subunit